MSKLFNKNKTKILNCKEKKAIIKNIIKDITDEKIPPEDNYNIEERLEKIKKILGIK